MKTTYITVTTRLSSNGMYTTTAKARGYKASANGVGYCKESCALSYLLEQLTGLKFDTRGQGRHSVQWQAAEYGYELTADFGPRGALLGFYLTNEGV